MYQKSIEHLTSLAASGSLANLQREGVERAIADLKSATYEHDLLNELQSEILRNNRTVKE